eukprot:518897_1
MSLTPSPTSPPNNKKRKFGASQSQSLQKDLDAAQEIFQEMEFKDSENFLFNGEPASISLGNGINGDEGATFFSNKDKKHGGDYIDMNKSDGDGDGYIGMHMRNMKKAFENIKTNRMDSDKYGNGNAKDKKHGD